MTLGGVTRGTARVRHVPIPRHPGVGHATTSVMMDRCVDWLHQHV